MDATSVARAAAVKPQAVSRALPQPRASLRGARLLTSTGSCTLRTRGVSSERRGKVLAAATEAEAEPQPTPEAASAAPAAAGDAASRRGRSSRGPPKDVKVPLDTIKVGATFKGIVKSIQTYGAFVDIGSSTDGLVHISQLTTTFVTSVQDVVKPGQEVDVRVMDVDAAGGRLSLTMKPLDAEGGDAPRERRAGSGGGQSRAREGEEGRSEGGGGAAAAAGGCRTGGR